MRCTHSVLLGLLVFPVVTSCVSVVRPPSSPEDPATTYLLMDDRHRGLLLPRAEGGFVEYGFGDWDWYANSHDSWYHVFDTVLWPTQGTLCRRFTSARNGAELRQQFYWMQLFEIVAARSDMESLRKDLAHTYSSCLSARGEVHNTRYRMSFVRHDDSYWFLHNCNDAVATWLEQLGCSVSWVPIRLDLQVEQ
ncbi:MAG: DUF2459 domain-containing protein [Planctomycetota bacterium]